MKEKLPAGEALRLIVEGTAAVTGTDFFHSLVRHLASALDPSDLDPAHTKLGRGCKDVARIGMPAQRQHGWVLQKDQLVADPAVRSFSRESSLQ